MDTLTGHLSHYMPGELAQTIVLMAVLICVAAGAWAAHAMLFRIASRLTQYRAPRFLTLFLPKARPFTRGFVIIFGLLAVLPQTASGTGEQEGWTGILARVLSVGLVVLSGGLLVALINALTDAAKEKYRFDLADNLVARTRLTQIRILERILVTAVVAIIGSIVLMSIPAVRQLGISLFASASVAGLVVGVAAQPVLSNLIAGIQLAVTQPIRIDDVVIVEGEWGRVEEIGATYVVIRIWDLRRLVVPLSYFMQKPFQNWTRASAKIIGSVFWYVDYTVPVDIMRQRLLDLLKASSKWDGDVANLQVTDSKESAVEVRALMSARDSSLAWDLRCEIREAMLAFLQTNYPHALPRVRAELRNAPPVNSEENSFGQSKAISGAGRGEWAASGQSSRR